MWPSAGPSMLNASLEVSFKVYIDTKGAGAYDVTPVQLMKAQEATYWWYFKAAKLFFRHCLSATLMFHSVSWSTVLHPWTGQSEMWYCVIHCEKTIAQSVNPSSLTFMSCSSALLPGSNASPDDSTLRFLFNKMLRTRLWSSRPDLRVCLSLFLTSHESKCMLYFLSRAWQG